MYSWERAGPIKEPWGTTSLIRYYCEDFPSRTTPSRLLPRKDEITPIICPEIG